jgi:hypothetical protein
MTDYDELLARFDAYHEDGTTTVLEVQLAAALRAALAARAEPDAETVQLAREVLDAVDADAMVYPASLLAEQIVAAAGPTTLRGPTLRGPQGARRLMADHRHQPDTPFGCTVMWGQPVYYRDMGTHVCNRSDEHDGRHQCKCGAWVAAGPATPTGDD